MMGKFKKFKNEKGVALLIVLIIIAIMIPIAFDMNVDSKTEFEIAMNYKKRAEAKVLALSGLTISSQLFLLDKHIRTIIPGADQFLNDKKESSSRIDSSPFCAGFLLSCSSNPNIAETALSSDVSKGKSSNIFLSLRN